ncbi:MAG: RHS repeat-associated core domain-containing protein [Gemmatimonadaceae bacterium]
MTDGNGNVSSRSAYSATGFQNTDSVWTNAGAVTRYTYDPYGRPIVKVTPLGTDSTWYRSDNRVDSASARLTPTVRRRVTYTYNNMYLTQVKDPKNQIWQFGYNALGWITSRTDPALAAETFQYDRNGQLRLRTNRRGQNVTFAYDALGRLTSQAGTNTYTWSYGNGGRTIVGTSPFTRDSATLTLLGAPDSVITQFLTASSQRYGRNYAYTAAGNLDSLRLTTPGNVLRARKWILNTAKGTLDSLRFGTYSTNLGRDANLDVTTQNLPKGDARTFNLGAVRATLQQSVSNAPSAYINTVNRWAERDNLGRLTRLIEYNGVTQRARDFAIDGFQQLTQTLYQFSPSAPSTSCGNSQLFGPGSCPPGSPWTTDSTRNYTYDAVGNRTDLGGTYTNNRVSAFNGCNYSTDADGNVTSRTCGTTTTTFVWSAEGTLDSVRVAVSGGSTTGVKLGYDANGRLVFRRVNGTPQSHFLWERDDLAAELGSAATTTTAEYAYLGTDQPYATAVGAQVYFAQTDPLGNVVALTDTAKVAQRTYIYDDWGKLIGGTDPGAFANRDRMRWKGALWLGPEADLYFMRARWYESGTGRFLSEDPIGLDGGVNPYVFAGSEPINGADPSGLCTYVVRLQYYLDTGEIVNVRTLYRTGCGASGTEGGIPATSLLQPSPGPKKPIFDRFKKCASDQLGLTNLMLAGGAIAAGLNIFSTSGKFVGATRGTSLASMTASAIFKKARIPFGLELPSLVGFPFVGSGVAVRATTSLARFSGRAIPVLGWALLAYDAAAIGVCTASDE